MNLEIAAKNLVDIKGILDKIGLKHWLAMGTFLGAYRDGKIIPYDEDTDLAMYAEDFPKLWINIGLFLRAGFFVDVVTGDTTFRRDGEHTDIYPFPLNVDKRFWGGIRYDVADFETLNEIEFLGQKFRILNNPEKWLSYTYGEDWRTPIKGRGCTGIPYSMTVNREVLLGFSKEIEDLFLKGKIKSPIHLSKGNEDALIKIFKHIGIDDWVFSNHRSHYHALLKGISKNKLKAEILANRSIHINDAVHHFFSSAIVGGCLPIALGVALAFKRSGRNNHCLVFVGDMAAETGSFHECTKYAARNDLPIVFIVEDNSLSTNTPTQETWGMSQGTAKIIRYKYERGYPHQGVGKWVTF